MQRHAQQAGGREGSYEEGIQDGFGEPRKELADLRRPHGLLVESAMLGASFSDSRQFLNFKATCCI